MISNIYNRQIVVKPGATPILSGLGVEPSPTAFEKITGVDIVKREDGTGRSIIAKPTVLTMGVVGGILAALVQPMGRAQPRTLIGSLGAGLFGFFVGSTIGVGLEAAGSKGW